MNAGVRLLESEGQGALTIRAVTREAGVSHGAPRRYFPTLSALAAAVARVGLVDLGVALNSAAQQAVSPRESLNAMAHTYVQFAAQRPAMFALIFRHDLLEGSGENLRLASRPVFDALIDRRGRSRCAGESTVHSPATVDLRARNSGAPLHPCAGADHRRFGGDGVDPPRSARRDRRRYRTRDLTDAGSWRTFL